MKNIKFVGLHGHSTIGSIYDAIGSPPEHMNFAYENGSEALALTDHGNMNGTSYQILHAKKMQKEGKKFKPIFGVEAYFIPSIKDWAILRETQKEEKVKSDDEIGGIVLEDEASSKKKKNPLNKRSHLVLLAQNQKGLNNIYKLVSESFKPGNFYRFPRIDFDLLRKHSEGVIVSSACLGGVIANDYWQNKENGLGNVKQAMKETIENFQSIFNDRFFGELQWNHIPEQHEINSLIIDLAKELNFQLVSTADSHYPRPELWRDRTLYKKLNPQFANKEEKQLPKTVDELGYELFPKNGDQMWEAYQKYSDRCNVKYDDDLVLKSITNTHHIAFNMIDNFYPDNAVRLPDFVVPVGKTADEALREMCEFNLAKSGIDSEGSYPVYKQRLDRELKVICDRGFSKYFLTMKAITDKAWASQLGGPGRGSGAGSLVAYLLNITQINPLKWNTMFERFLRSDATDYPDIDTDWESPMNLKEEMIQQWGNDKVVAVTNYNTLKISSLVKDISKFYNIPYAEVNEVTSKMLFEAIPKIKEELGIKSGVLPEPPTFEQVLKYSPTFNDYIENHIEIKEHILNLFKQTKSISRHAGGIVVGEKLDEFMPLIYSGGVRQTPWSEGANVRHLEPLGFIKFDVLGLSTLRMIRNCIELILKKHCNNPNPTFEDIKNYYNQNLHPDKLNFDDQAVYEDTFHKGNFIGIFQFAEEPMQRFAMKAQPKNIIDLSILTSIWRPGCLSAKIDEKYLEVKEDATKIKYIHSIHKKYTEKTFGFLIFQEQISQLAHELGKDISLDDANLLRKVLTKKGTGKEVEVKDRLHNKFIDGCLEKNISKEEADLLWQTFIYFNGYGFNFSHALAYSVISFQCAWLLHYYSAEWVCSYLNEQEEEKKISAIGDAKSLKFIVTNVDINLSGYKWQPSPDGKSLIQPLSSIKGLGDKAIEQILENRPFATLNDLLFNEKIKYQKLNKRGIDVLVRSGACDQFKDSRFKHNKHFWLATAFDRPKTIKQLEENIEKYKNESDFTLEEKISNIVDLTGVFPVHMIVDEKVIRRIDEKGIPGISNYDPDLLLTWFIIKRMEVKQTKTGKDFLVCTVIDNTGKEANIKIWSYNSQRDKLSLMHVYIARLKYDDRFGFSSNGVGNNFKMIG